MFFLHIILALNQDRALREVLGEDFCKLVHFSVGKFLDVNKTEINL